MNITLSPPLSRKRRGRIRGDALIVARVGDRIRALRMAAGMSQAVLGKRIGLTFQQIQKYESGDNRVAADTLHKIATVFAVPTDFFFETSSISGSDNPVTSLCIDGHGTRLARAFSSLTDSAVRNAIVDIVEQVARTQQTGV